MKSFDSRTYSINDFLEWDKSRQLVLDPKFQRRSVWTDKAKSFLMDTIIRGKPIPKIFIRQRINVSTRSSIREVVDGQQRLRTILSYLKDGFAISRGHHPKYGGHLFSQLAEIDENIQSQLLAYEMSVDLLIDLPDSEVLDVFSRLNSYAVVLNEQEKLNAKYFGPFKTLADRIGHKYFSYWSEQGIFTSQRIMRMEEVTLVADLLIAMVAGVHAKKQIKSYYAEFEKEFGYNCEALETRFDATLARISAIFSEGLRSTEFRRPHVFYSLFTAVDHALNGLPELTAERPLITDHTIPRIRSGLDRVETYFQAKDTAELPKEARQFLEDSRRATTDVQVRKRRTEFLLKLMQEG
ncbi:MAG: DUF262 domain-containing protein [Verrucomicrobia bacterium]|nr:DUF262 domain-containing protein [Verrucomicrobiota bacterium]